MGTKLDADLRGRPDDPNQPRPVGDIAGQFAGSATAVMRLDDRFEYGEEVPIRIVPAACEELPLEGGLYWSGIEVTVDIQRLRAAYSDPGGQNAERYFIVAALEPAEWGWCVAAPLRGENKHLKTAERDREIRAKLRAGRSLRELDWDPFLRDRGRYAARLNDPISLHYACGYNLDNGFLIGNAPAGLEQAEWRFGVCPLASLRALGLEEHVARERIAPRTSLVRTPRVAFADLAQAAALFACAGRAGDRSLRFDCIRARAEKALLSAVEGGAD
jgi:hypothetical protein